MRVPSPSNCIYAKKQNVLSTQLGILRAQLHVLRVRKCADFHENRLIYAYLSTRVALSQHHAALLLIYLSIVGLSITSPGSHVPHHRWSQHHVSRLALMLALTCLAVAIHSQSHIHALHKLNPRFAQAIHSLSGQSTIHGLRKTFHGWSRSPVCTEHIP